MTEQISSSTRPLLRQIAALQQLLEEQREAWLVSERTLTQRAVRAETERTRSDEQCKNVSNELHQSKLNIVKLDGKYSKRRSEHHVMEAL